MGTFVKIKLKTKTEKNISRLNKAVKALGLEQSFMSEQDFHLWSEDPKNNPDNLSVEQLKENFKWIAEVGVLMFDVKFSRTSDEDATKYANFIVNHLKSIESIDNANELISKYDLSPDQIKVIKTFVVETPEPLKLPESEQYKPDLQGGLMLCKSFSPTPFWVVFGNVTRPTFVKEKIYKDDNYNNLYRDKKGYAYMLLPLMPINNRQIEFVEQVYDIAHDMGLLEDPNYFLPVIYGMGISNLNTVAELYKVNYTQEEIIERFQTTLNNVKSTYEYNGWNGFVWKDRTKRFMYTTNELVQNACDVLTCLVRACIDKNAIAEIMSKTLDITFKVFEFEDTRT